MKQWEFDVFTVLHDDLKDYGLIHAPTVHSRIVLSPVDFPEHHLAQDTAACLAVAVHGGMPVTVLTRI